MMEIEFQNGLKVKGDSDEMADLVMKLIDRMPGVEPKQSPTIKEPEPEPEVSLTGQVARTIEPNSHDRTTWGVNLDSPYMRIPKKRFKKVAQVYDYIAEHKRGRTTEQLVDHFHTPKATMWSRLYTLQSEGLIYQPGQRGTAWIAVPEQITLGSNPANTADNAADVSDSVPQYPESEAQLQYPTPAVMPHHVERRRVV